MLAVSPLRDGTEGQMESFPVGVDNFPDFGTGNFLDSIDFDDLFFCINEGDVLPDLEMYSETLAEFSLSRSDMKAISDESVGKAEEKGRREEEDKASVSGSDSGSSLSGGEEIASKNNESSAAVKLSSRGSDHKGRKPSRTHTKNSHGNRRKIKVDWTPELHRRFVKAVEKLGVDKAVPSRILEVMGIDCLTRHNIASHLQKYRSHQKHLLAREEEASRWSQRRQIYGGGTGGGSKKDMSPSLAATMGFPHPTPLHPFRPLHVWGHPTVDHSLMWSKHLVHTPSPPRPTWLPPPPPLLPPPVPHPAYWHLHHQVPNALRPGNLCFQQPLATTRFGTPTTVPGIPPPHSLYKVDSRPPLDFHPSKESIDAVIGDVLLKPWLPLPLGLKPPSHESVFEELHHQGI